MATFTWLGNHGTGDVNDATQPANWLPLGPPSPGDTVLVPSGSAVAPVTLDLIGTAANTASLTNNSIAVGGSYDIVNFTSVAVTDSSLYSGSVAAPGQGFVWNLTDSTLTGTTLDLGNNTTLSLTGSTVSSETIDSTSTILQNGSNENLVINAAGTVNLDGNLWAPDSGGVVTANVTQDGTAAGLLSVTGAMVMIGSTLVTNGDPSNIKSRFSNSGLVLADGSIGAPALVRLNARNNSANGAFALLGGSGAVASTLDINTNMSGGAFVVFGDSGGLVKVESNTTLSSDFNVITGSNTVATTVLNNLFSRFEGFKPGDSIDLAGLAAAGLTFTFGSSATWGPNVLLISQGGTLVARLRFTGAVLANGSGTVDATGTVDTANTTNFKLVSDGAGGTLITLANTVTVGGSITVTGAPAVWSGVTNGGTVDWGNTGLWTSGTGTGGLPGQYQTAQFALNQGVVTNYLAGTAQKYTITVATPQTAGAVLLEDPLATLDIGSTLTLATLPGQGSGGGLTDTEGRVQIDATGKLTGTSLQINSGGGLTVNGGSLQLSGVQSFSVGSGSFGVDIESDGTLTGGTITSAGYFGIGQTAPGSSFTAQNNGSIGAHVTALYTTVGAAGGATGDTVNGPSTLTISGPQTTWSDTGTADVSAPYSGGMVVGGGDIAVDGLGNVYVSSNGKGAVLVQNGATLNDLYGFIAAARTTTGSVDLEGNARWNIDAAGVANAGSIVIGITTLWSSGLPELTVGAIGTGALRIGSGSVVQLGTYAASGTAAVIIGGGGNGDNLSNGAATIDGAGSALLSNSAPIIIGNYSTGDLVISNGGTVLANNGTAATGISYGVAIANHFGTATGGGASNGTLAIGGGTGTSALIVTGALDDGRAGTGLVTVASGGLLTTTGGLYIGSSTIVPGGAVASGQFVVNTGTATVSGHTLDIYQGSAITLNGTGVMTVGATTALSGELTVGSAATLQGAGTIAIFSSSGSLHNAGLVIAGGLSGMTNQTLEINAVAATVGTGAYEISANSALRLDSGVIQTPQVTFLSGAARALQLVAPSAMQGTITGFSGGATIDLVNTAATTLDYNPVANQLTVENGAAVVATFSFGEPHSAGNFVLQSDGAGGSQIVACYAAGTRLLTQAGEAPVEALRVGDLLPTRDGRLRPVRWIGRTRIDLDRHPAPQQVAPVRVHANAFAPGMPHRDLVLSPDHAIAIDDALVPVHLLANGATIRREPAAGIVEYFHVELDRHAIVFAEGLPAESYLDAGNRFVFEDEAARALHPDLMADLGRRAWDERSCAPLLLGGPLVAAAHARIDARATGLGHTLTDDPALVLLADGVALPFRIDGDGVFTARLPAGATRIALRSRSAIPRELDAGSDDDRRLGVALASLRLGRAALDLRALAGNGLHDIEASGTHLWRWTNGDATISVASSTRPRKLTLTLLVKFRRYRAA
jgi:T5SS/PEP-CTERM-associated repeat protein